MVFNGLRLNYALECTSDFVAWKDHMEALLNDNGLLEYIKKDVAHRKHMKPRIFISVRKCGQGKENHIGGSIGSYCLKYP